MPKSVSLYKKNWKTAIAQLWCKKSYFMYTCIFQQHIHDCSLHIKQQFMSLTILDCSPEGGTILYRVRQQKPDAK